MEQRRLMLHEILCDILGSRNCYFSPPTGKQLKYPCIVYKLANIDRDYADNIAYTTNLQWQVTAIDEDPDSELVDKVLSLPKSSFGTSFSSDDLNHFVFSLYF